MYSASEKKPRSANKLSTLTATTLTAVSEHGLKGNEGNIAQNDAHAAGTINRPCVGAEADVAI